MGISLDTLDPDNYMIGVVHLPPGQKANLLFPSDSSEVQEMLKKFFKKVSKRSKLVKRPLPSARDFELTFEGDKFNRRDVPFVGPSSKGGYCLRQLRTYNFQVCLVKSGAADALKRPSKVEEATQSFGEDPENLLQSPKKFKRRKLEP